MADTTKQIDVLLKAIFDSKGFDELQSAVGKTIEKQHQLNEQNKGGKGDADQFGGALDNIKGKAIELAAQYVAVTAAWGFVTDSFKQAVEDEKIHAQLAATLRTVAGATDQQVEAVNGWINAAEAQYGIADDKLIPAFQQLVGATQSVAQSQYLMKIAMDNSKVTGAEVGESVQQLTQYMVLGKVRGVGPMAVAVKELEAESRKAHKGHVDHAEVIEKLRERMEKQASQIDVTSTKLDQNKIKWDNTKEAIGKMGLTLVEYLEPATKVAAVGLAMIVAGLTNIGAAIKWLVSTDIVLLGGLKDVVIVYFQAMSDAMHGHFIKAMQGATSGILEAGHKITEGIKANNAEFAKMSGGATAMLTDVLAVFDKSEAALGMGKKAREKAAAEIGAGIDALSDKDKKAKKEKEETDAKLMAAYDMEVSKVQQVGKSEMQVWEEQSRIYKKMAGDMGLSDVNREKARVKSLDTDKQIAAEKKKILDKEAKDAQELADKKARILEIEAQRKKVGVAQTTKEELKELQAEKKMLDERLKAVAGEVDAEIKVREKLLAVEKKIHVAETKIVKEDIALQRQRRDAMMGYAAQGIEIAKGAFGESKEIKIAEAIINGISAAMKAFEQGGGYPGGIVPMVMSIATSAVQVANLEGTGFDDPDNDLMMRMTTKRWAQDMAREASAGWGEGLSASKGSSNVTNITNINNPGATNKSSVTNVYGHELIDTGSDAMLRKLSTKLDEMKVLTDEGLVK